jgi:putative transposase
MFREVKMYKHYKHSVGHNFKHVQITPKYRYSMMRKEKLKVFCKVSIEEACKNHRIDIVILKVMPDHVHMIVDCPRTMCDSKLVQIIKGLSAYLLFRICPNLRKRYPNGHFWNGGYFCCSVGAEFDAVFAYIDQQELHHATQ